jgi:hypothetical protein
LAHLSWLELVRLLYRDVLHDGILAVLVPYSGCRLLWDDMGPPVVAIRHDGKITSTGLRKVLISFTTGIISYPLETNGASHSVRQGDQVMVVISDATARYASRRLQR